ncbi:MAG TPA: type IX secretion system protein PorQ [Sediminibacterium sp.]|nr:type IX secretion system protein PorQ [Sediminibacterium sp.]
MRRILFYFLLFCGKSLFAQTLGGNTVYGFLLQPNTAGQAALGGLNISQISNDVGMCFQNPALLRSTMHCQANTSFNDFLAGVNTYSMTSAWYLPAVHINLAAGTQFFDYGMIQQTDASGNILGSFHPVDYVAQLMAAGTYHDYFHYGLTSKFIHSGYGIYRSDALAFDAGLSYYDSSRGLQAALVIRNMGAQIRTYSGTGSREELPFDLEIGLSKRLKASPFQFSLTLHHLQSFRIHYNDTSFRYAEGDLAYNSSDFFQNLLSHCILGVQVYPHEKLELMAGMNFQRRIDLNAYQLSNGLNGFSFGAGLLLKKVHIRYATGFYQQQLFHQFSLNFYWKGGFP